MVSKPHTENVNQRPEPAGGSSPFMSMDLNPEIVCFLIDLAKEFHVKEDVTLPESSSNPSDDWSPQVLADHQDDPSYQELVTQIEDLEPDQQITLVALMWLGRGDFTLEEWPEAQEQAAASYNNRSAEYLITTPLVADYWREGLNLLEYSCGESD